MSKYFPDHGLPLVQLKEKRRDLVIAFSRRNTPLTGEELVELAAVQQAISAFLEVTADLEADLEEGLPTAARLSIVGESIRHLT